jgi:hypothetical protein
LIACAVSSSRTALAAVSEIVPASWHARSLSSPDMPLRAQAID